MTSYVQDCECNGIEQFLFYFQNPLVIVLSVITALLVGMLFFRRTLQRIPHIKYIYFILLVIYVITLGILSYQHFLL